MGSTSGHLHGDSMFGPELRMILHCWNLVEWPCLGLIDGAEAKSVWLDVNFDLRRVQVVIEWWFTPHHQILKDKMGFIKLHQGEELGVLTYVRHWKKPIFWLAPPWWEQKLVLH